MTVGLATLAGTAIPLESIAIRGELVAGHALLRFVQTYRSNASVPIEAIYTFPLPAEGAVVDFRYRCGGRELTGELREREAAFREYDEAVREGHGAALVERERDDVFTASVGNLLPGETVEIEVEVLLPGQHHGCAHKASQFLPQQLFIGRKGQAVQIGYVFARRIAAHRFAITPDQTIDAHRCAAFCELIQGLFAFAQAEKIDQRKAFKQTCTQGRNMHSAKNNGNIRLFGLERSGYTVAIPKS